MLLVFTALMAMCNQMASVVLGDWMGLNSLAFELSEGLYEKFDLSFLLGLCFSPLSFLIGVTPEDCLTMGRLLGTKIFLNEFIAYQELASFQSKSLFQDPKSIIVATYALCGFSNFASIGIQVGGIGVLVPGRRPLLSQLAFKAMLGGTLACLMTAAVASILI